MSRFDAIVVGGGPAGSTAARELAAAGARVLASVGDAADVGRGVRAAPEDFGGERVQDDCDALAAGEPVNLLLDLRAAGVDAVVRAQVALLPHSVVEWFQQNEQRETDRVNLASELRNSYYFLPLLDW